MEKSIAISLHILSDRANDRNLPWLGIIGEHAGGTSAERAQIPGLARLEGGTLGRREAHTGEVWKSKRANMSY